MPVIGGAAPTSGTGDPQSLWNAGHAEATSRYINYRDDPPGSGNLQVVYFHALRAVTVGRLGFEVGGTAASGVTLARMALFTATADDSLTLVARTGNDATFGGAIYSPNDRALDTTGGYPATYALVAGSRYAFGLLFVGGTAASIRGMDADVGVGLAPTVARQATGQTDIDVAYTGSAMSRLYRASYMYGLAA